ncbi:oxidation resistance protein 1 [Plakobranchus ocellatus]|uniref:Oxidation resistance protein 1 n=1 Tax=Plakobranchus ocellatus TaxID=259542 RepID=A0AAV4CTG4_9GAST|nr:oxidation resistance protein 1 [Plakobranchus ocellatus]
MYLMIEYNQEAITKSHVNVIFPNFFQDVPYVEMADRPMPAVPGHAVQVTSAAPARGVVSGGHVGVVKQTSKEELDEADQECLKRFLKMPVRRFVEHVALEDDASPKSVIPCKGTLLLTPNALMFDPDVSDPLVLSCANQSKYQLVVYMEDLKSVAIYNDYLKKPKLTSVSPKAETYRGIDTHPSPSGSPSVEQGSKGEGSEVKATGRTSEELEKMGDMVERIPDMTVQPGRASEEIEHAMAGSGVQSPSMLLKQMSRSSEAASCEISQLGATSDVYGETRDFGPHLGRSSSEVHRQLTSTGSLGSGRVSVASPNTGGISETISTICDGRSELVTEGALSTPTQGFAPVHFTDRSPHNNDVIAHPTPVPGQRASASSTGSEPSDTPATNPPSMPTQSQQLILSPSSLSDLTDSQRGPTPGSALSQNPAADSLSALAASAGSTTSKNDNPQLSAQPATDQSTDSQGVPTISHQQDQEGEVSPSKQADISAKEGIMSSFSPSQQISNFFHFTSSFIRGAAGSQTTDKKSPTARAASPSVLVTPPSQGVKLKSGCSKEDLERVLGPSPDVYKQRGDTVCFTENPYYLQLRPGIPCDRPRDAAPRAFDHRNEGGYLDEYWFAVPRNMADRLYNFLMTWQPEAYGDQEETAKRDKFFYDQREVQHLLKRRASQSQAEDTASRTSETNRPRAGSNTSDLSYLQLTEDHFSDQEKAWLVSS